jgi:hypothetical protein
VLKHKYVVIEKLLQFVVRKLETQLVNSFFWATLLKEAVENVNDERIQENHVTHKYVTLTGIARVYHHRSSLGMAKISSL